MSEFEEFESIPEGYQAERREIARRDAVQEYMGTSPHMSMGEIPEEKLKRWKETLGTSEASLSEMWIEGWITAELAMLVATHDSPEAESPSTEDVVSDVTDLFTEAADLFEQIADPQSGASPLLRSQAGIAAVGMMVWSDGVCNRKSSRIHSTAKYVDKQSQASELAIKAVSERRSVETAMWADTLTFISLMSSGTHFVALPCSPRLASPNVDSYYRRTATLFDGDSFIDVRVGSKGSPTFMHIPYELLGNENYQSRHGLGTLQAVAHTAESAKADLDFKASQVFGVAVRLTVDASKQTIKANEHLESTYGSLFEQIVLELNKHVEAEVLLDDPAEWVRAVQPGRNPYVVDPERTDAAISPLELKMVEETITPAEATELAWWYTEVAFGRAIDAGATKAQILGDIDRAEEIFSETLQKISDDDALQLCEVGIGHASAWMQRIVLCNEPFTPDDVNYYQDMLVYIGRRAVERYGQLPPDGEEARALAEVMQKVTLCLLVTSESDEYVMVATPPRQHAQNGWDVNVWPRTAKGFVPREYGRMRITEKEDISALSDGIVTVTRQHLGDTAKAGRRAEFRVFTALADERQKVALPPKTKPEQRRSTIEKSWKVVETRIIATKSSMLV